MGKLITYFKFISGLDRKLGFVGFEVCEIFREIVASSIRLGVKCDEDEDLDEEDEEHMMNE